jgi:hypothetical protein
MKLPSPAMAVSLAALVVALGGTAVGATYVSTDDGPAKAPAAAPSDASKESDAVSKIKFNQLAPGVRKLIVRGAKAARVPGPPGAAGPAGPAGAAGPNNLLWAVVNSGGQLVRSNGAVSVTTQIVPGDYIVTFNRNISGCSYVAGVAASADNLQTSAEASTRRQVGQLQSIEVFTVLSGGGALTPRDFHLLVAC